MTTITDEAVEAAAHGWLASAYNPNIADNARNEKTLIWRSSISQARAALTAALPFLMGEQGSSQDPGHQPCGEQPSPAVSATAALAPDSGWVRRSDVIDALSRLAGESADLAIEGGGNARNRESMEAAFTRAKYAVAFLPAVEPCVVSREMTEAGAKVMAGRYPPLHHHHADARKVYKAMAALAFGATASTTPETGTEKVAAARQQEPRDEPKPDAPTTAGGE